jgi:hypothetical protein
MILVLQCMAPPLSTGHHQRDVSAFQMQSGMQRIEERYTQLPPTRSYLQTQSRGAFGPCATAAEASAPKGNVDYMDGQAAAACILGSEGSGLGCSVHVGGG